MRLPEEVQTDIREGLRAELDGQRTKAAPEMSWARKRVVELEHERRRLARGVVEGSIPGDLAREEQDRIKSELKDSERILATTELVYARIQDTLNMAWVW